MSERGLNTGFAVATTWKHAVSWFLLCSELTGVSCCQQGSRSPTLLAVTVLTFPKVFIPLVSHQKLPTQCLSVGVHSSLPPRMLKLINAKKARLEVGSFTSFVSFFNMVLLLKLYRSCCNNPKHLNYGNAISQKSKNKSRFEFKKASRLTSYLYSSRSCWGFSWLSLFCCSLVSKAHFRFPGNCWNTFLQYPCSAVLRRVEKRRWTSTWGERERQYGDTTSFLASKGKETLTMRLLKDWSHRFILISV